MTLAKAIVEHTRWLESLDGSEPMHSARIELAWRAVRRARDEERESEATGTLPRISVR